MAIKTINDGSIIQARSRYQLVKKLAQGGFATVYLADRETKRSALASPMQGDLRVIKVPLTNSSDRVTESIRLAQIREGQILHFLASASVDGISCLAEKPLLPGESDPECLVMKYFPGKNLMSLMADEFNYKKLPLRLAVSIIREVANTLASVHDQGILHGDIKPSNILVEIENTDGELKSKSVKLVDFGAASFIDLKRGLRTGGTPEYYSPEQATSSNSDIRSDIFSLGITFFEMITGDLPFISDNEFELAQKIAHEIPPIYKLSSLPPEIERIVLIMLAKAPSQRYQSCKDLVRDLDAVLTGLPAAKNVHAKNWFLRLLGRVKQLL